MSQENVELIRAGYAAWTRGDLSAVLDLIDENITITGQVTPDGRPAQGREGLLANARRVGEAFDELTYEPVELIDLGDRVLAHIHVVGTGRDGISAELRFGQLWTIKGRKAVRVENYTAWEDALEAARVRESAMSEENVDIVRRCVEGFARGGWGAVVAEVNPRVEWIEMPSLGPDAASYTGVEELRQAIESWIGKWNEYDLEVSRYIDADGDVVVLARERGRGGVSDAPVERELGEVWTLREGTVVRVRLYGSWAEAVDAAGLRE
jgi:uncharacterized protein